MGQSFRKMFDSLFGSREMRVVMLGEYTAGHRVPGGARPGVRLAAHRPCPAPLIM